MNRKELIVAPSVLSADFSRISDALQDIASSGAQWVHLDVMDGDFVPDITFGHKFIQDIRRQSNLIFDTHLMVEHPETHIESFAEAGSDYITFHVEATTHAHRVIQQIKQTGKLVGISIIPSTPICMIEELLADVDIILIMTVNPGYSGQRLIERCVEKVKKLAALRDAHEQYTYLLSVDGGVNTKTIKMVKDAGVDVVVAGSAFFSTVNKASFVESLKKA